MNYLECKQCGGAMRQRTQAQHNLGAQLAGVVVFLVGLFAAVALPLGIFWGGALMLGSLFLGYRKRKLWVCESCGYHFERI